MYLNLHLAPADPAGLAALADAVSRPGHPREGAHLSRAALAARVALAPEPSAALRSWLRAASIDATPTCLGGQVLHAITDPAALARLLGPAGARTLTRRRRLIADDARAVLPADLAALVCALDVGPWRLPEPPQRLSDPGRPPPPAPATGLTPADLARGYDLDRDADGDGETIAMMALGGIPDPADLYGFAHAFGLPAPQIELVPLTPLGACARDPRFCFETTMALQWTLAVAPRARVVVYLIDPGVVADPWATFLLHVLSDISRAPAIAVTSWSAPARQYYSVHGRQRIAGLLDQAAAIGLTVVAASGDWGVYDGFPGAGPDRAFCDDLAPHATFPGCEARVLSVGGTHVVDIADWREIAWSAPVSAALHRAIGLSALAGSGGVSPHVPVPDYQRPWLPASFSRGSDVPTVPASGRVQPDVACMAWGPDLPGPAGPRPTAYACLLNGEFRDDAGGTSVAAPIWAAILARINQLRRRRGHSRLGQLQPRLYSACARHPDLLRDIDAGHTDIDLPILGAGGLPESRRLPGFVARRGFDPATGLGVPSITRLQRALASPNHSSDPETLP